MSKGIRKIELNGNTSVSLGQMLVLFLLFLGTMNFMAKYFYLVYIAFVCCIFLTRFQIKTPGMFYLLGLFSLSMILFAPSSHGGFANFMKPLAFPMCYFIGYNMLCHKDKTRDQDTVVLAVTIISLAAGAFFHLCLNMFYNPDAILRNTVDIWSNTTFNATGQAALCCVGVGCCCAVLTSKTNIIYKLVAIVAMALMIMYNLVLATRTLIVMVFIIEVVAVFHFLKSRQVKGAKMRFFIGLVIVLSFLLIAYQLDFWSIRTSFEESNFFQRVINDGTLSIRDSRIDNKLIFLSELWRYPLGGSNLQEEHGYAHDLLLDAWDEAGIVAFIVLIVFVVYSFITLYRMLVNHKVPFWMRQLVLCVYCAFYLEFMIEPILQGIPWLLGSFCIVNGIVARFNHKERFEYDRVTAKGIRTSEAHS